MRKLVKLVTTKCAMRKCRHSPFLPLCIHRCLCVETIIIHLSFSVFPRLFTCCVYVSITAKMAHGDASASKDVESIISSPGTSVASTVYFGEEGASGLEMLKGNCKVIGLSG